MTTVIDRRRFLEAGCGLAAGLVVPASALAVGLEDTVEGLYASAAKDAAGRFVAVLFDAATGREEGRIVLPSRGHDITQRPKAAIGGRCELVAFARRPGNFAVVFGDRTGGPPRWLTSRPDRYFYGHGVFSRDGRLLYTTENDFEAGTGVIGVRDATSGYRQIGELPSGGIGPHDLAMLSDGHTLVVANGGIKTHPSTPRLELNLSEMQPTLAYVDTRSGETVEVHGLPAELHQLSIRHLTVGARDTVYFGCQYRGAGWQTRHIVGRHRRGSPLELLPLPDEILRDMRNYVASLEVDETGETAVIAAPRGGLAVVLDVASGRYLGRYALDNVFGVARLQGDAGFLMTSGNGVLASAAPWSKGAGVTPRIQPLVKAWDNHLLKVR